MSLPEWRSSGQEAFQFEIEIARRLTEIGSPVASLDTRVEPRVYERDGFAFTLWRHYEQPGIDRFGSRATRRRLSGCMRVWRSSTSLRRTSATASGEAQRLVASHDRTPRLEDSDRELLLENATELRPQDLASDPHASSCCMASRTQEMS